MPIVLPPVTVVVKYIKLHSEIRTIRFTHGHPLVALRDIMAIGAHEFMERYGSFILQHSLEFRFS